MIAGHRMYIEKKAVSPRARDWNGNPTAPLFRREELERKARPAGMRPKEKDPNTKYQIPNSKNIPTNPDTLCTGQVTNLRITNWEVGF